MKEAFIELLSNVAKLFKVKSLMSIAAIAMFIYLTVSGVINGEQAMTIIAMVFTAYFVHTANTKDADKKDDET